MNTRARQTTANLDRSQDEIELSALMRQSQAGDADSYMILLNKVQKLMSDFVKRSFSRLGLGSAHEDVVQDILLAIHSKRATYDPAQYFLPWLYAIARYKTVDHLRKLGARRKLDLPIEDEVESLEAVAAHSLADHLDVTSLIASLPPKQREVLTLVKLDGLSVAEAAKRTGYSASDIKVTVHRALKALRDQIKDSGHGN